MIAYMFKCKARPAYDEGLFLENKFGGVSKSFGVSLEVRRPPYGAAANVTPTVPNSTEGTEATIVPRGCLGTVWSVR